MTKFATVKLILATRITDINNSETKIGMWAVWHHFCLELICQNCFAHSVLVLIVLSMMLLNSFLYCVFVNRYFYNPVCIYSFKVNNRNTRERYAICSKLTIKTPGRSNKNNKDTRSRYWRRFGALTIIL